MIFKTHAYNLPQIAAALKKHDAVWFHGDGNIYVADTASKNHRDFVNPKQEEAKYRIKFTSPSQLPRFVNGSSMEETEKLNEKAVESINELLMKSRNAEIREERKSEAISSVLGMDMHDDLQPKKQVLAAEQDDEDDDQPSQKDIEKTFEARMKAQDEAFEKRMAALDAKTKELDEKSAALDKKAAELNKKAPKGTAAASDEETKA